jgi:tRNA-binding EMAP/Myf-like protein
MFLKILNSFVRVLGEILEIAPHPNADKLQVTKTAIGFNLDGTKNIQQIVCGAKNIAVGQKVPVATIGTKLKSVKGDFIEINQTRGFVKKITLLETMIETIDTENSPKF